MKTLISEEQAAGAKKMAMGDIELEVAEASKKELEYKVLKLIEEEEDLKREFKELENKLVGLNVEVEEARKR